MPDQTHLTPLDRDFREYLFQRYQEQGRKHRCPDMTQQAFEDWQPQARIKLAETLRMPDVLGAPEFVREKIDPDNQPWSAA